jgi:hypothetical protein
MKFIYFLFSSIILLNSCISFPNPALSTYTTSDEVAKYVLPYKKEKVGTKIDKFFVQNITVENINEIIKENKHTLILFWYPCPSTRYFVKDVITISNEIQNKYPQQFKSILVTPEYSLGAQQKTLKEINYQYITYLLDEKIYGNSILKKHINFISAFDLDLDKKKYENLDFILFDSQKKPIFIGFSEWNKAKKHSEIVDYEKFLLILKNLYP